MPRICANCGGANPDSFIISLCQSCGASLSDATVSEGEAPAPVEGHVATAAQAPARPERVLAAPSLWPSAEPSEPPASAVLPPPEPPIVGAAAVDAEALVDADAKQAGWTCPDCGARNHPLNTFCTYCGGEPPAPGDRGAVASASSTRPPQVGPGPVVRCRLCGHGNPPQYYFCEGCGKPLQSTSRSGCATSALLLIWNAVRR